MVTPNQNATNRTVAGLILPPHDYEVLTYIAAGVADDDFISTITGYVGGVDGVAVGTLTYTYVDSTNNVATIALTLPTANG